MPKVLPGNQLAMYIIGNYLPIFFNGMGGINTHGIEIAVDLSGVLSVDRLNIIDKIVRYCIESLKTSNNKEDINGKEDTNRS